MAGTFATSSMARPNRGAGSRTRFLSRADMFTNPQTTTCHISGLCGLLIPPQYVKPYVKRGKNDRNDAEAICEAAGRPGMHFVPAKSVKQRAEGNGFESA